MEFVEEILNAVMQIHVLIISVIQQLVNVIMKMMIVTFVLIKMHAQVEMFVEMVLV